jgi:hypothetical protein
MLNLMRLTSKIKKITKQLEKNSIKMLKLRQPLKKVKNQRKIQINWQKN